MPSRRTSKGWNLPRHVSQSKVHLCVKIFTASRWLFEELDIVTACDHSRCKYQIVKYLDFRLGDFLQRVVPLHNEIETFLYKNKGLMGSRFPSE